MYSIKVQAPDYYKAAILLHDEKTSVYRAPTVEEVEAFRAQMVARYDGILKSGISNMKHRLANARKPHHPHYSLREVGRLQTFRAAKLKRLWASQTVVAA